MRNPRLRGPGKTSSAAAADSAPATPSQLRAQAPPSAAPVARPTPRQSEIDVGADLGQGARPQVSYRDGKEVRYATPGSVRPDCVTPDGVASIEVRNYSVANNQQGLVKNVSTQAIDRVANLLAGMEQQVVIDIRGQVVSDAQKNAIIRAIVSDSEGANAPDAITFKQ
jgi:filamentous hemagglutinin